MKYCWEQLKKIFLCLSKYLQKVAFEILSKEKGGKVFLGSTNGNTEIKGTENWLYILYYYEWKISYD